MNKNESLTIRPLQNGYIVEYDYRELTSPDAADKYDRYEYQSDKSMFSTWDEVVAFVTTKKMDVPPAKM